MHGKRCSSTGCVAVMWLVHVSFIYLVKAAHSPTDSFQLGIDAAGSHEASGVDARIPEEQLTSAIGFPYESFVTDDNSARVLSSSPKGDLPGASFVSVSMKEVSWASIQGSHNQTGQAASKLMDLDREAHEDGTIEVLVVQRGEDEGSIAQLVLITLALNSDGLIWLVPFTINRRQSLVVNDKRTAFSFVFVASKALCAVAAGMFLHLGFISEEVAPGVPVLTMMRLLSSALLSVVGFWLFCQWTFCMTASNPFVDKADVLRQSAGKDAVLSIRREPVEETSTEWTPKAPEESPVRWKPTVRKVKSRPHGWEYPGEETDSPTRHGQGSESAQSENITIDTDNQGAEKRKPSVLHEKAEESNMVYFLMLSVINAIPDTAALFALMLSTAYTCSQLVVAMLFSSTVAVIFCSAASGLEGIKSVAEPLPLWCFIGLLAGGNWIHIAFDD
eukprot:TRINITY_DN9629_c0_g1_i2.p1 TRINITY_DN9629_c0_g1~~TRINITY_DN9629_c0_g1_i2.p1  ORF type:complete len:446 (+),score=91.39 TRINITY_DN9629_c0_g1_i2:49-1386(+)